MSDFSNLVPGIAGILFAGVGYFVGMMIVRKRKRELARQD